MAAPPCDPLDRPWLQGTATRSDGGPLPSVNWVALLSTRQVRLSLCDRGEMTRAKLTRIQGQTQEHPGTIADLQPAPDHGETSWVGRDRLPGRRVLITG